MNDQPVDVPWLKMMAEGFGVGAKWVAASLLLELPVLIGMIFGLVSVQEGIRLALVILVIVVGMGVLFAVLGTIYLAYFKFRWARFLVLSAFVLFFAVQIFPIVVIPYVVLVLMFMDPLDIPLLGQIVVFGLYWAFMYWWTKVQYAVFFEYKAISKIVGWIMKVTNQTEEHRQKLRRMLEKSERKRAA